MNRITLLLAALLIATAIAGCTPSVDEELLPTPVPTLPAGGLTMDDLVAASQAPAADEAAADETAPADEHGEADAHEAEAADSHSEEASEAESSDVEASGTGEAQDAGDQAASEEPAATNEAEPEAGHTEATEAEATEAAEPEGTEASADDTAHDADAATPEAEDSANEPVEADTEDDADQGDPGGDEAEAADETEAATEEPAAESDVETDLYAGLPENIVAALGSADPARGEQLTVQNACSACHALDPNQTMAGPTWHNLAETAATRVEGQSAAQYIYNSITATNEFIVDGYAPGVMIQTYGETLSDEDLADIIAYLLTLHGME